MKLLIAAAALLALTAAPALAAEKTAAPAKGGKRDPNEMICKVQGTAAGIPQRVCTTRAEWEKASARTRSELMMTQRPMCGISGC